jgi:hypothetical protein
LAKNVSTPEFQELAEFLGVFFDRYMTGGQPHAAEVHPLTALCEITERSPKKALDGLRMAIDDCIDMAAKWPPERVREVDEALQLAGVVTVSELRRRYWRKFRTIVDRGVIVSQSEYYLVKGVTSGSLDSPEELLLLETLLINYENQIKR